MIVIKWKKDLDWVGVKKGEVKRVFRGSGRHCKVEREFGSRLGLSDKKDTLGYYDYCFVLKKDWNNNEDMTNAKKLEDWAHAKTYIPPKAYFNEQ